MPATPAARTFTAFLAQVEDGELHEDLTRALTDLIATLHDHAHATGGKPAGTIAITLKFRLDREVVEVAGDLKVSKPKTERARSIFWTTPENHLTRLNPRQQALPFRDVAARQEIR
jgi:hypothetical protein